MIVGRWTSGRLSGQSMMGARMGAMYRLKAYFGMVPAEEMGEYADDPLADRYAEPRRERSVRDYANERWDDRFSYEDDSDPVRHDRYDDWDRRPARPVAGDRSPVDRASVDRTLARGPSGVAGSPVRGALAIDPDAGIQEPLRPVPATVPEQRERPATGTAALSRITTLQPRSYRDARTIGERYRSGVPVIMNLTELEAAEAKRLVDFAAGLVFALHGGFDKVTNRVFLLTPADVEVSADDARMLAQRSVSGPGGSPSRGDVDRGGRGE